MLPSNVCFVFLSAAFTWGWNDVIEVLSMPKTRQSSLNTSDMKFVPLSLWRLMGFSNFVINITTDASATNLLS